MKERNPNGCPQTDSNGKFTFRGHVMRGHNRKPGFGDWQESLTSNMIHFESAWREQKHGTHLQSKLPV